MSGPSVEAVFRAEYGRAMGTLVGSLGDIDLAQDMVQEAFVTALTRWPERGMPANPGAWIVTTAKNRAIDLLRRERRRDARHLEAVRLLEQETTMDHEPGDLPVAVEDERLRLLFTCCHPALGRPAQVALTLRLLGGLTTPEIAHAFLVPEPTMAQRLVRAKAKIRDAHIPYRIPERRELPARLGSVLAVLYLIFNEGYSASAGPALVRDDLCQEALRLARVVVALLPEAPEGWGLLALMLLIVARRPARTTAAGDLIPLAEQDRSRWDRAQLAEGRALVRRCLHRNQPGPYQLQAAIQAVHSEPTTDWRQVLDLYDQLWLWQPTPVVALHRAVAQAEVHGPASALDVVDGLALTDYQPYWAIRADLLRRLDRRNEAHEAYGEAIARSGNGAERRFLEQRRTALLDVG